jgi:hypothetical protein
MKLIDIETGVEYETHGQWFRATGKVYERREYACAVTRDFIHIEHPKNKTHKALCFLEPIEKPMPKLEAGDYAEQLGGTSFYVMEDCVHMYITCPVIKIYRQGKLIWSKDGNS